MSKVTALKNHLEFKKTSVNSKEKIKDIKRYLSLFINSTTKPLSKFTEADITKFINSLEFSIRTINDIKAYIKSFIKWNYKNWSSQFRNLDKICKPQKAQRAYEPEQMISIKEFAQLVKGEKDVMWKCYWLVMFYGGFRPGECCALKWDHIFFESQGATIKLHATKTGKDFYKGIPKNVEHLLKEWKKFNSSEFIFPSPINKNDSIKSRSVCARLKRLSKRTLKKEIVPYQLRHSIATILYSDDKRKDDDTAKQLGHSKSMKEVYMNLDEDGQKIMARRTWIKTKPLTREERVDYGKLKKDMKKQKKEFQDLRSELKSTEKKKKEEKELKEKRLEEWKRSIEKQFKNR